MAAQPAGNCSTQKTSRPTTF